MPNMNPLLEANEHIVWSSGGNGANVTIQKFYNITTTDSYLGKNTIYSKANIFLTNTRLLVCGDATNQMAFELIKMRTKWITGNGKQFFNFSYDNGYAQEKYQFMAASTFVSQTDAQVLFGLCPVNVNDTTNQEFKNEIPNTSQKFNNPREKVEPSSKSVDPELEKLRAKKAELKNELKDKKRREEADRKVAKKLELARKYERQLDYEHALDLYRELDRVEDIRRVNKSKMQVSAGPPTTIVQGNYIDDRDTTTTYVDDRDTIIKDSVVSKSNIEKEASSGSLQVKIDQLKELHAEGLINDKIYEERMEKLSK